MIYRRNGQRIDTLPEDFYSSKNYTDSLIAFIDGNRDDEKPFFAYASYTAPHDPLHAPAEYVAKYGGTYDDGWDALARKRLASLQELGLVPGDISEFPPNFMTQAWDDLPAEQKAVHARDMEVYAAMVEYMDMSIGRLFEYLREVGLYDNTLIVFFSDNGANGAHATAYPGNADGSYLATFDNTLENRGLPGSFIDMGPNWAQASSAPFRFFKSFTTQGGIRSPLIAKFPGPMTAAGQWSDAFLHVTDLMPTFLEIAGATYPQTIEGRAIRPPIGRSMLPVLNGSRESVRDDEGVGYELFEMRAYLQNEWKLLRLPEPFGTGGWELYNLAVDPGEIHDVSAENPDVKAALAEAWERYAEANDVVDHQGRFDAAYRAAYGDH
jgi:arylsulfatase